MPLKLGIDVYLEKYYQGHRKARLGVLCHPASVNRNYRHTVGLLLEKGTRIDPHSCIISRNMLL